jgi:restriction system protein
MARKAKGPKFLRFYRPIVEVLREIGGSGRSTEVTDLVIERMKIPESEQQVILKSGQTRVYNQIHWARLYLVKAGLLSSAQRGVWSLTEKGRTAELTDDFVLNCFKETHRRVVQERKEQQVAAEPESEDEADIDDTDLGDYRTQLLNTLKALPPEGFERLCQRLLRENGFQQVTVTGRTGDG